MQQIGHLAKMALMLTEITEKQQQIRLPFYCHGQHTHKQINNSPTCQRCVPTIRALFPAVSTRGPRLSHPYCPLLNRDYELTTGEQCVPPVLQHVQQVYEESPGERVFHSSTQASILHLFCVLGIFPDYYQKIHLKTLVIC